MDESKRRRSWRCLCECGNVKTAAQVDLLAGDTKSCGCLKKEKTVARNKRNKVDHDLLTVGQRYAYRKWRLMWNRVRNPHNRSTCYKGVKVCNEWLDFFVFYKDMGAPERGHSLDRVDNAKGYEPANCRWVPLKDQARNTSRNRNIEFNGVVKPVSAHAQDQGLSADLVFDRLNRLNWSETKALATPKMSQGSGAKAKRDQPRPADAGTKHCRTRTIT